MQTCILLLFVTSFGFVFVVFYSFNVFKFNIASACNSTIKLNEKRTNNAAIIWLTRFFLLLLVFVRFVIRFALLLALSHSPSFVSTKRIFVVFSLSLPICNVCFVPATLHDLIVLAVGPSFPFVFNDHAECTKVHCKNTRIKYFTRESYDRECWDEITIHCMGPHCNIQPIQMHASNSTASKSGTMSDHKIVHNFCLFNYRTTTVHKTRKIFIRILNNIVFCTTLCLVCKWRFVHKVIVIKQQLF